MSNKKDSNKTEKSFANAEKEEREKEKEEKWGDVNEPLKFVCQGAKVECQFCSPSIGIIMPTSTQVMLQDKPYATNKDNDGKVNFNFVGVCTHPSQQKPFCPPPPCKAVISLGAWKDVSDTNTDDYQAILVRSTIPCMVSGMDLKITHSGQMGELNELEPV